MDQRAGRKTFDGNITGEVLVVGAINFSHAASADLVDDAIVAQLDADEYILAERSPVHGEDAPSPSPHAPILSRWRKGIDKKLRPAFRRPALPIAVAISPLHK